VIPIKNVAREKLMASRGVLEMGETILNSKKNVSQMKNSVG
jgi:hypothetical protein